jgi:hypothetical protein
MKVPSYTQNPVYSSGFFPDSQQKNTQFKDIFVITEALKICNIIRISVSPKRNATTLIHYYLLPAKNHECVFGEE